MRLLFDWFCCLSCGQKWRRGCRMEQSKLSPHTPSSLNRRKKVEGILTFYFKFSNLAQVIYLSSQHCLHQRNVYAVFLVREGKKKIFKCLTVWWARSTQTYVIGIERLHETSSIIRIVSITLPLCLEFLCDSFL